MEETARIFNLREESGRRRPVPSAATPDPLSPPTATDLAEYFGPDLGLFCELYHCIVAPKDGKRWKGLQAASCIQFVVKTPNVAARIVARGHVTEEDGREHQRQDHMPSALENVRANLLIYAVAQILPKDIAETFLRADLVMRGG
jgi:hypothetical protein